MAGSFTDQECELLRWIVAVGLELQYASGAVYRSKPEIVRAHLAQARQFLGEADQAADQVMPWREE